jgi:hypothetical protein
VYKVEATEAREIVTVTVLDDKNDDNERMPSSGCYLDGVCFDFVIPEDELTAIFGTPEHPNNPKHEGSYSCAVLPETLFGGTQLGETKWWVDSGVKAFGNDELVRGTIIATFVDGKYPNANTGSAEYKRVNGNHVAIYWGQVPGGIKVIDQFGSGRDGKPHYGFREIHAQEGAVQNDPHGRPNNAQAFTIVRSFAPAKRK